MNRTINNTKNKNNFNHNSITTNKNNSKIKMINTITGSYNKNHNNSKIIKIMTKMQTNFLTKLTNIKQNKKKIELWNTNSFQMPMKIKVFSVKFKLNFLESIIQN